MSGVVTVSAAFGAGGPEIARAVADQLGLTFHDRAIPARVAIALGVPVADAEANDETVARGLWRMITSLGSMPDPVGGVTPLDVPHERAYREQTEHVLREIADGDGGVVLGRAAAMVLAGRDDALHVRLDGSPERRLTAAAQLLGQPEAEVRGKLESADAARTGYVKHFYRGDPEQARHYHLVLDSTVLPHDTVIGVITSLARTRGIAG